MSFARRFVAGAALVTLGSAAARILAFVTIPILTRALGPEPYGMAALAASAISLAAVMAVSSVDLGYARHGLRGDAEHGARVERFAWRWTFTLAALIGLAAGVLWIGFQGRAITPGWAAALYVGAMTLLTAMTSAATTRARLAGRYARIGAGVFCGALATAFVSMGLALDGRAGVWALLIGALVGALAGLFVIGLPGPNTLTRRSGLERAEKREILTLSAAIMTTGPIYWVVISIDRWFIEAHEGAAAVGIYVVAAQLAFIGLMANSAMTLSWYPEIARLHQAEGDGSRRVIARNMSRVAAGLMIVWLAVSASGGDVLRLMAAPQFHDGAAFVPWLAAGVTLYGLASLFNSGLFLAGRMRFVAMVWVMGGIAALAGYSVATPIWGAMGAAWVQAGAFGLIALGILVCAQWVFPLPLPLLRLGLVGLVTSASVTLTSPAWHSEPILSLGLKVPAGLILAMLVAWLVEPRWPAILHGLIRERLMPRA